MGSWSARSYKGKSYHKFKSVIDTIAHPNNIKVKETIDNVVTEWFRTKYVWSVTGEHIVPNNI